VPGLICQGSARSVPQPLRDTPTPSMNRISNLEVGFAD